MNLTDDVVRMGNQIAREFETQPLERAAAAVATHLRTFWDPRMRARLAERVDAGDAGLHPLLVAARALLSAAPRQRHG